jgi:acyl-CoA thioester hydrolase
MTDYYLTYRGIVYPWHCDHMGHMNVMWYAGKFDEACWQTLSMLGLTPSRLRNEGAALAAAEQHTEYKRELHAGDAITIRTAILQFGEKSLHLSHEMQIDETREIAATCTIVGIYLDAASRRPQPFPLDVRERRGIKVYNAVVASPFSDTGNCGYLAEMKDYLGGWELSRS